MAHLDKESELYRGLMDYPERFEEGFDFKTILAALFAGFVMLPGAIYLGLMAGLSLGGGGYGGAAEWTILILFTEIARRSFVTLRRQEVILILSVVSAIVGMQTASWLAPGLAGGPFGIAIWNQYFVRSPAAKMMGIASQIPRWAVPAEDSPALLTRTFFHPDWLLPGALLLFGLLINRMSNFGAGYILFRLTSDYQRLAFPMAPVNAQGATALAETTTKTETWRWRVFSIGAMIGLVFGMVYLGVPTISGVILTKPVQLIPIPWVDFTRATQGFLPASATPVETNLANVFVGFILPFGVMTGSAVGVVVSYVLNRYLYQIGVLSMWQPGMGAIETGFANGVDFYLSFLIGVTVAVALIGFWQFGAIVLRNRRAAAAQSTAPRGSWKIPPGRGDVPMWVAIALWLSSSIGYVLVCHWLVPEFKFWILGLFAFVIVPIESYVNTIFVGITGDYRMLMTKELTFILSGYRGIKMWFAPMPYNTSQWSAQGFRTLELTGTKVMGAVKAEIVALPITIVCSLLFWQFVWRLAPIPSVYYPYAQTMWQMSALGNSLWFSSTLNPEDSLFYRAWSHRHAIEGIVFALGSYGVLTLLRLPVSIVFGFIRSIGISTQQVLPQFIGAALSQFYFARRFGMRTWKQYASVLMAGYSCGTGLIGMGTIAIALIGKSVSQLPY